MFDLSSLDCVLDLAEFFESFRFRETKVSFNLVPSAKKNKFFIITFFVDSPATVVSERRSVYTQIGRSGFENPVEVGLFTRLDEVPANGDDRCIERNCRCSRLKTISLYPD